MVYILTDGIYSDYHIIAVFAKREDAERVIENDRLVNADIEEWELNNTVPKMPKWRIHIYSSDGTIAAVVCYGLTGAMYDKVFEVRDHIDYKKCVSYDMRATDMQHAIKIAHEQWAQRKSNGEFDK